MVRIIRDNKSPGKLELLLLLLFIKNKFPYILKIIPHIDNGDPCIDVFILVS